jgi:primary-amine oxidase
VPSEYVPEFVEGGMRTDLKSLEVVQPEAPRFKVSNKSLVEWQNWLFRVGVNPHEGATIHDVRSDGRSVLHHLSFSETTVPDGDPRPPFQCKQAFAFEMVALGVLQITFNSAVTVKGLYRTLMQ